MKPLYKTENAFGPFSKCPTFYFALTFTSENQYLLALMRPFQKYFSPHALCVALHFEVVLITTGYGIYVCMSGGVWICFEVKTLVLPS